MSDDDRGGRCSACNAHGRFGAHRSDPADPSDSDPDLPVPPHPLRDSGSRAGIASGRRRAAGAHRS